MKRIPRDLTGQRFAHLAVLRRGEMRRWWLCRCDCGVEKPIRDWNLISKQTKSCGCVGHWTHGQSGGGTRRRTASPTYRSWSAMKNRCFNPKTAGYARYGAVGIGIDPRWLGAGGFERFLADMGERPAGTSIDRRDNSLGYSKANCRWATAAEQVRNRAVTKLEAHEPGQIRWLISIGAKQRDVARFFGVSATTVSMIKTGTAWSAA